MAFFDEIGKKITQASQGVVQKTKDTTEIMKLNGFISDEEKRIKNLYFEIGKAYFEAHADSYEPIFAEMILEIKEAQTKIDDYTEQVKRLKGVILCPICGADVAYGAPFCSACGSKINLQEQVANQPNSNVNRCTNCGVPLKEGSSFCTNCGTKVEVAPVAPTAPVTPDVPVAPVAPAVRKCANCGKELAPGTNFCTNCGTKFVG